MIRHGHPSQFILPAPEEIAHEAVALMYQRLAERTLVMGILNVTPDSFSDGGLYDGPQAAAQRALEMVGDGADIIDIGGESTRPGAEEISTDQEIDRIGPVIEHLSGRIDVPISVDTTKARVAVAALEMGASIINDISGAAFDPEMASVVAQHRCPVVLMHIKGTPRTMQQSPTYVDLMGEIKEYLAKRISVLTAAGVDERLIILDPGFGFGKTVHQNLEMIARLHELCEIGRPILIGTSRKSTIGKVLGDLPVDERVEGTAATVALSIAQGASIVRVHDVKAMSRVSRMTDAIVRL